MAGEDRRRQLIEVAIELFSQRGFAGTTTKEIAAAAGVTEAVIFRHFATKHADLVFTVIRTGGLDACREHVQAYHKLAREEYGREVRVWTVANVVQGETEKEARDFYRYYVHEKGDWQAAENMMGVFAADINRRNIPPERLKAYQEAFIAGWGGFPLIGTKEQIVDGLSDLSRAGLDGVLLAWPRFDAGMRQFRDVTYPLVRQAGLRGFL